MELLEEAGLPPGVINLVTGDGDGVREVGWPTRDLAGIHFTGSTAVFKFALARRSPNQLTATAAYPRLVGETGGKDFVLAHPSADVDRARDRAGPRAPSSTRARSARAASRAYIPASLWPRLQGAAAWRSRELPMGDVARLPQLHGRRHRRARLRPARQVLERARADAGVEVLAGGKRRHVEGWFVQPTRHRGRRPDARGRCREELLRPGPDRLSSTTTRADARCSELVDAPALRPDRRDLRPRPARRSPRPPTRLRYAAGNFYINDKPTGAVVGQQPFGGARASGTNDKAGSMLNLLRWVSPRAIKETFVPPRPPLPTHGLTTPHH